MEPHTTAAPNAVASAGPFVTEPFPERPREPEDCQGAEAGQVHPDTEELGLDEKR